MSESEILPDLIRREQELKAEIEIIRAVLVEGEASGEARPFDVTTFKQFMWMAHS
jgi:antitoxin ParD1/3/4